MFEPIQASVHSKAIEALRLAILEKTEELGRIARAAEANELPDPIGAVRRFVELVGLSSPLSIDQDIAALCAACAVPPTTKVSELFEWLAPGNKSVDDARWLGVRIKSICDGACAQPFASATPQLLRYAIDNEAWDIAYALESNEACLPIDESNAFSTTLARLLDADAAWRARPHLLVGCKAVFGHGSWVGWLALALCANPKHAQWMGSVREDLRLQARLDELAWREIFDPYVPECVLWSLLWAISAAASEAAAVAIAEEWRSRGGFMEQEVEQELAALLGTRLARTERSSLLVAMNEAVGAQAAAATESPAAPRTPKAASRRL